MDEILLLHSSLTIECRQFLRGLYADYFLLARKTCQLLSETKLRITSIDLMYQVFKLSNRVNTKTQLNKFNLGRLVHVIFK